MTVNEQMEKKGLTRYRLSKDSGIPYTTVNDICTGKAKLEKCSAETVYRLSKTLGVSMESLLEPYMTKRLDFELFKSNVCHRLKELGDKAFIVKLLQEDAIGTYAAREWFPEALYLLAMLDYVSRNNGVALCSRYDELRRSRLREPLYPTSVLMLCAVTGDDEAKEQARQKAIPEFLRFNIIESEVWDIA